MFRFFLIVLILIPTIIFGQTEKDSTFFGEFGLSTNRTFLEQDDNISNDNGFGLYTNFYLTHDEHLNFIFGIEYNMIKFNQSYAYAGNHEFYSDVDYTINTLTLPLSGRLTLGNKIKFIYEFGIAPDIHFFTKLKGWIHSYSVDTNNHLIQNYRKFSKNIFLIEESNNFDFGISNSIGLIYLIRGRTIITKMTYDYGLGTLFNLRNNRMNNRYAKISIGICLHKRKINLEENLSQ